jgi:hypothetical protein
MSYSVTNRQGETFEDAEGADIDAVLAELDEPVDEEHPDVSLSHETEWALSAFPSGLLVWENVEEDDEPRHLTGVDRSLVRSLWLALAKGDLATVEAQPWRPGYGS